MQFESVEIPGLIIVNPTVHGDHRGYFFESYSKKLFTENGIPEDFVQDNQSLSGKGILRGLHFQAPPFEQGKLVRVIQGAVYDVAVDVRKSSPTYGRHFGIELNADNKRQLWIPPGFAHGFVTLADDTIFCYKCSGYYHKESEGGLIWNDPKIGIDWPISNPTLSEKDTQLPHLDQFKTPFV